MVEVMVEVVRKRRRRMSHLTQAGAGVNPRAPRDGRAVLGGQSKVPGRGWLLDGWTRLRWSVGMNWCVWRWKMKIGVCARKKIQMVRRWWELLVEYHAYPDPARARIYVVQLPGDQNWGTGNILVLLYRPFPAGFEPGFSLANCWQ